MLSTVELLKYLWPLSSSWTFSTDVIESEMASIRMEKLDRSAGAVRRKRRRKRQENSSASAFVLVPGGVNALLPLFLPLYTNSLRPPRTRKEKEKVRFIFAAELSLEI